MADIKHWKPPVSIIRYFSNATFGTLSTVSSITQNPCPSCQFKNLFCCQNLLFLGKPLTGIIQSILCKETY